MFHSDAHAVQKRAKHFRWKMKNWAGHHSNATCSRHFLYLFNVWEPFLVTSLDVWLIGQCNSYQSSPCVFRTVDTNFTLIGNDVFFGAVIRILCQKCLQKLVLFSFLRYLGEMNWDSQNVWTCMYTITRYYASRVSSSEFQVLICSDTRDAALILLFGWPSSCNRVPRRWKLINVVK